MVAWSEGLFILLQPSISYFGDIKASTNIPADYGNGAIITHLLFTDFINKLILQIPDAVSCIFFFSPDLACSQPIAAMLRPKASRSRMSGYLKKALMAINPAGQYGSSVVWNWLSVFDTGDHILLSLSCCRHNDQAEGVMTTLSKALRSHFLPEG